MEQFLVAVDVVKEERRPFSTPIRERQRPPAASFVDHELAGLEAVQAGMRMLLADLVGVDAADVQGG